MTRYVTTLAAVLLVSSAGAYWFVKRPHLKIIHKKEVGGSAYSLAALKDLKNIVPVVVVGSGPAGLSAALYTARSSLYTVVFQGEKPGGQLTTTTYVENWPGTKKMLGTELIAQNRNQAEKFGAVLATGKIEAADLSVWPFKLTTDEGHEINALTVIIATGATPKRLNCPGEEEYWGKGVTTCAVCDAPYFKDKDVVVIGGGDSAVEQASLLVSYAKNVTMLVRGSAMRAAPAMKQRITDSKKIQVLYNTEVLQITGQNHPGKEKEVTGIELKDKATGKTTSMSIDGVFLAIGHTPNTQVFSKYVQTNAEGYITLPNRTQETSLPGIYAAGDVADFVYRQAGVAAGDGIKAALDASMFLQEHGFNDEFAKTLEKNYYEANQDSAILKLTPVVTVKDFDAIAKKSGYVVVDVGADYCSSCHALLPLLESAAAKLKDKAHFVQINLSDNPKELVQKFDIKGSIPQILIVKDGQVIKRFDHPPMTKRAVLQSINEAVTQD
ncbi:FAD-dependent oxidoreductase [Candidatus Dependentiae bacterium]|nr:FAD-dependent oxidoreductase [Candidatus Dependentiae bacterium]